MLGRLDRSIDEARGRRLGVDPEPRPTPESPALARALSPATGELGFDTVIGAREVAAPQASMPVSSMPGGSASPAGGVRGAGQAPQGPGRSMSSGPITAGPGGPVEATPNVPAAGRSGYGRAKPLTAPGPGPAAGVWPRPVR